MNDTGDHDTGDQHTGGQHTGGQHTGDQHTGGQHTGGAALGPRGRDADDLREAIAATTFEPRCIERVPVGDGTSQVLALGEPPRASVLPVAALFLVAAACGLAAAVVYVLGAPHVVEGLLLGGALLALGIGTVSWSRRLLPEELALEERPPLDQGPADDLEADLARPELAQPGRRLLLGSMIAAGGAFAVGAIFPLRSLGPDPGDALATTSWRSGLRLVRKDGTPVHRDDIPVDGALTVFPEGHTDAADSQVMLLRVPDGLLNDATAAGGVVGGRVAYSKVCSHAGCPVGQFRVDSRSPDVSYELLCPCHQSLFDVLDGARVLAGPAATPLPQLPIAVDRRGYLVATGDFPRPVGPQYWNAS